MLKRYAAGWTAFLLSGAATGASAATLSLSDAVGDANAATVVAGQPFTVTLQLTAEQAFQGYSIFLNDPAFVDSGRFTINNLTRLVTNPFTDANSPDDSFLNDPIDAMTSDLGYTSNGPDAAAGTYDLMAVTITPDVALATGTYAIGFDPTSGLTTAELTDVSFTNPTGYSVSVVAVPEPSTLAVLTALAFGGLIRRRK